MTHVKGLLGGRMEAIGNAMPTTFSDSPLKFGLYFLFWCLAGAGCLWFAWWLARSPAQDQPE